MDETTWKLSFETNEFSTYALAYTVAENTTPAASEPEEESKGTVTAPKTDDTLHGYGFWFILMAVGIAVGAAGFIWKKKSVLKKQGVLFF